MSEKKIKLKIITPEKVVFDEEVDEVYAQGEAGSFGILPNHIPFMSTLATDAVKAVKNGQTVMFSVIGGIFQFKNNEAVILTEVAENGADIDKARAKLAKERAEAEMGSAQSRADLKKANAARARAMARLKASAKNS